MEAPISNMHCTLPSLARHNVHHCAEYDYSDLQDDGLLSSRCDPTGHFRHIGGFPANCDRRYRLFERNGERALV